MESERHAFMRKLLQLCVDNNVEVFGNEGLEILEADSSTWIDGLTIDLKTKEIIGYWDGDEHRVIL